MSFNVGWMRGTLVYDNPLSPGSKGMYHYQCHTYLLTEGGLLVILF